MNNRRCGQDRQCRLPVGDARLLGGMSSPHHMHRLMVVNGILIVSVTGKDVIAGSSSPVS